MSDTESSGAVTAAAETASTPSTPPNPTLPSTFSNTRGSGLARGKRPASPAATPQTAAAAVDYTPTAVSVITAPTEYKNPFAPPAPAPAEPVTTEAPSSAAPAAPEAPAAEVRRTEPTPAPVQVATAPVSEPVRPAPVAVREPARPAPAEVESKPAELKILPPEATKRVEHNWESDSFRSVASQPTPPQGRPADAESGGNRRDERRSDQRQYFRPERERREGAPGESRGSGQSGRYEAPAPTPPPPAVEAPKSGGFFGWVKKLFGGAPVEETPKPQTQAGGGERRYGEGGQGGQRHRRRRRGHGRGGFQGDQHGPRDGQSSGENRGNGGDNRGNGGENRGYGGDQRQQHGRRRRHYRSGGGDYRGGNRPEGGPPAGS